LKGKLISVASRYLILRFLDVSCTAVFRRGEDPDTDSDIEVPPFLNTIVSDVSFLNSSIKSRIHAQEVKSEAAATPLSKQQPPEVSYFAIDALCVFKTGVFYHATRPFTPTHAYYFLTGSSGR
jgi:hypothetical protein